MFIISKWAKPNRLILSFHIWFNWVFVLKNLMFFSLNGRFVYKNTPKLFHVVGYYTLPHQISVFTLQSYKSHAVTSELITERNLSNAAH